MSKLEDQLLEVTQSLYEKLIQSDQQSLSKTEIFAILGDSLAPYYTFVINGLAEIKKVTRNRGPYGGVSVTVGIRGLRQGLLPANINSLRRYFASAPLKVTVAEEPATEKQDAKKEKGFYEPLQDYLERTGLYEIVSINPKLQGSKWENADLALVSYDSDIRYHPHLNLKLYGVEVKRGFPTIENVQQAASYLRYSHGVYLCYYDDRFRGSNIDIPVARLRDEGIWELAQVFKIGLIISYRAQESATSLYFQTLREAPSFNTDPSQIERGLDLWMDDESKKLLRLELVKQVQKISANL